MCRTAETIHVSLFLLSAFVFSCDLKICHRRYQRSASARHQVASQSGGLNCQSPLQVSHAGQLHHS